MLILIFEYLQESNLLCENQSGFHSYDSCEYQIFSIVHKIYASFNCNPHLDIRTIFLDISKAFDRVWHEGLIYKIKCMGITGLELIQSFLNNRLQRVVLNSQTSAWTPVLAGVPQSSLLSLCFLDIHQWHCILSTAKLFANDTSIFSVVNNINVSADQMNKDLENRFMKLPSQRKI